MLRNDEMSRAILLEGTNRSDETDQALKKQLATERAAGHRASAIDPPFATLAEQAKLAIAAQESFIEELGFLTDAFAEWTENISTYGFAGEPPERLAAIAIVAALLPEISGRFKRRVVPNELAQWLLEQPIALRMLNRMISYATCTFIDWPEDIPKSTMHRKAIERAFIARVFREIREEIDQHETSNDAGLAQVRRVIESGPLHERPALQGLCDEDGCPESATHFFGALRVCETHLAERQAIHASNQK